MLALHGHHMLPRVEEGERSITEPVRPKFHLLTSGLNGISLPLFTYRESCHDFCNWVLREILCNLHFACTVKTGLDHHQFIDLFPPLKKNKYVPLYLPEQMDNSSWTLLLFGYIVSEFNKSGRPAGHQVQILWGPAEIYTVPVRMSDTIFLQYLSKYFLLPTWNVFRMFVGSIIFVPMFGLLSYYLSWKTGERLASNWPGKRL